VIQVQLGEASITEAHDEGVLSPSRVDRSTVLRGQGVLCDVVTPDIPDLEMRIVVYWVQIETLWDGSDGWVYRAGCRWLV